eukprot:CAMPEP_0204118188 /NCGR_PEP_ID=MMETSP0361-20130328/6400_1 /ASSEMBLY_ACC=CAM_ASM_000343 /TAXON_ID=268821 /ORGANISM="Scrippsiella Hangoei, Strain SHTV-5" /LENGTH=48 /DNA_ID= /DNA_START= /DNA_END= /DNA_ORIENTATION=
MSVSERFRGWLASERGRTPAKQEKQACSKRERPATPIPTSFAYGQVQN